MKRQDTDERRGGAKDDRGKTRRDGKGREQRAPSDCEPTPMDASGRDPSKPKCPEGYPEEQPTDAGAKRVEADGPSGDDR